MDVTSQKCVHRYLNLFVLLVSRRLPKQRHRALRGRRAREKRGKSLPRASGSRLYAHRHEFTCCCPTTLFHVAGMSRYLNVLRYRASVASAIASLVRRFQLSTRTKRTRNDPYVVPRAIAPTIYRRSYTEFLRAMLSNTYMHTHTNDSLFPGELRPVFRARSSAKLSRKHYHRYQQLTV